MERITITLSPQMKGYIEDQVSGGAYGNISEYVRDLIRQDQDRRAHDVIEQAALAGLQSGPAKPWTKKTVDGLIADVQRKADARRQKR